MTEIFSMLDGFNSRGGTEHNMNVGNHLSTAPEKKTNRLYGNNTQCTHMRHGRVHEPLPLRLACTSYRVRPSMSTCQAATHTAKIIQNVVSLNMSTLLWGRSGAVAYPVAEVEAHPPLVLVALCRLQQPQRRPLLICRIIPKLWWYVALYSTP